MRDTYDADEVAVIEDKAYQVGVGIGEMNERERIIKLLMYLRERYNLESMNLNEVRVAKYEAIRTAIELIKGEEK